MTYSTHETDIETIQRPDIDLRTAGEEPWLVLIHNDVKTIPL